MVYDPSKISYGRLPKILFSVAHDPTQLNRQGPNTGSQYRSVIFFANEEQQKIAQVYVKASSAGIFSRLAVSSSAAVCVRGDMIRLPNHILDSIGVAIFRYGSAALTYCFQLCGSNTLDTQ